MEAHVVPAMASNTGEPHPRAYPFRVGASSCAFAESSVDGSVYEEWLSQMADVDPKTVEDITEGLVSRDIVCFVLLAEFI